VDTDHRALTVPLVDHALNLKYDSIPAKVIERMKQHFLDFLAVSFGGSLMESSVAIMQGVNDLTDSATGSCVVLGDSTLYPPHYAALLNGTFAHTMDFDDTHRESIMHPGATIFPTLLALAEETKASGKEFLTAAIVGYDVGTKVGKAHGPTASPIGFMRTSTLGLFASTAAGARLLGLTADQTKNAMGLNISQAAGSMQFMANGAWNNRIQAGLAAHNAILSLRMACRGFLGASDPIEGRFGYLALYARQIGYFFKALDGLGSDFEVMNTGIKPYPSCRQTHTAIDAITHMVSENELVPADIEKVQIYLNQLDYDAVGGPTEIKAHPSTAVDAQFSVYFAAAVSAVHGCFTWDSYQYIETLDIQNMIERIHVNIVPTLANMHAGVTIVTRDGRQLVREPAPPKGDPENPMSWEEIESKFKGLADKVLGTSKTRSVSQLVNNLEMLPSLTDITRELAGR
jgi:2-methylcitrate dehydratase PrpD